MQDCYRKFIFVFFIISTSICTFIKYPDPSLSLQRDSRQRVECDLRTKRPTIPSFNDCEDFLELLSIKSHKEPSGAYSWYGRTIGMCEECIRLPTIVHYGNLKCAALIDVDDKNEKEIDLFGLRDLWLALNGVIGFCWLQERHNGRRYPGSNVAWKAFVRGVEVQQSRRSMGKSPTRGNSTVYLIDLDSQGGSRALFSSR